MINVIWKQNDSDGVLKNQNQFEISNPNRRIIESHFVPMMMPIPLSLRSRNRSTKRNIREKTIWNWEFNRAMFGKIKIAWNFSRLWLWRNVGQFRFTTGLFLPQSVHKRWNSGIEKRNFGVKFDHGSLFFKVTVHCRSLWLTRCDRMWPKISFHFRFVSGKVQVRFRGGTEEVQIRFRFGSGLFQGRFVSGKV